MGKVIGVFSGKGGVGKTTLVANMAASLTKEFGKRVVVVDTNVSTSHLGLHLGLYEDPKVTLKEVLLKKATPASALYIHPSTGIRLLPAPLKGDFDGISLRGIENVVDQLSRDNDIVIVDAAPGLGREVVAAIGTVDEAMVVATPDIPSVTDALKTINLIKKVDDGIDVLGLIVNRVQNERYELTRKEIESACNINVITHIPEDSRVPESIAKGSPAVELYPHSKAGMSFNRLSAAIVNQTYDPHTLTYALMKIFGLAKEEVVKIPPRSEREHMAKKKFRYNENEDEKTEPQGKDQTEERHDEARDIEKLTREINESVKADLKKRLSMKIKEKLKERGIER